MIETSSIRPMGQPDVEDVARLLAILFAQERDFTPDPARQHAALALLLAQPQLGIVLVANRDQRVVGSVMLLRSVSTALGTEVAWLEDLVVDPAQRGIGIGSALLDAAIATARDHGWRRISVLTDADNHHAQRLYTGHEFARSEMVLLRHDG